MILPESSSGNPAVYEVEAGRELNLDCISDITANLEVSRFEDGNGTIAVLSGKTKQSLFKLNCLAMLFGL